MFQSTRPRGARQGGRRKSSPRKSFNPRARAGRDQQENRRMELGAGFNPRARAGRDQQLAAANVLVAVSIHAPARGATGILRR